jgi:hypothetical protein
MCGAVPPLPQYAFMAWCSVRGSTGTTLTLPFIACRLHATTQWDRRLCCSYRRMNRLPIHNPRASEGMFQRSQIPTTTDILVPLFLPRFVSLNPIYFASIFIYLCLSFCPTSSQGMESISCGKCGGQVAMGWLTSELTNFL